MGIFNRREESEEELLARDYFYRYPNRRIVNFAQEVIGIYLIAESIAEGILKHPDADSVSLAMIGTIAYISGRVGNGQVSKKREELKEKLAQLRKKRWDEWERSRADGIS